jgi:hypothetical protein
VNKLGAEPYWYFVEYNPDIEAALQTLRQREFQAGRYNPVIPFPEFPIGPDSPAPGAGHASIEEALHDADADGTRSILDLERVTEEPGFGAVSRLGDDVIMQLYGTTEPTRQLVEENAGFMECIERYQGIYIVLYKDGKPDEICFAGYSAD